MNQTMPPNNSSGEREDAQAPSFAQEGANPYYGGEARQASAPPSLDAGAPVLTVEESQRLNRKALLFLGGIVVLLLLLGYFVLWGKGAGADEEKPKPTEKASVVVPTLPSAADDPIAVPPPIEVAQQPEQQVLPPLPEQNYAYSGLQNQGALQAGPKPPTLLERRMGAAGGASPAGEQADGSSEANSAVAAQVQQMQAMQNALLGLPPGGVPAPTVATPAASAQFMSNPNALLVRGTYLRCVLESRIVTDIPGFTSCTLTEPVYSVNGKQLLLPKGSKILGSYDDGEGDIDRVAVVWDRIITPTGIDVTMSSPGTDGLGGAGHPGDYNGHWGSKIASALLVSLISDAFQWGAAEYGPRSSTTIAGPGGGATVIEQPFQSATARSMERLANQALQKSAQRKGTVTINQGSVINVYVAQDVDFSAVMALR